MSQVTVLDEHGGIVIELDPEQSDCKGYTPNDLCGGCDACLLKQAVHYGYRLAESPPGALPDHAALTSAPASEPAASLPRRGS